MKRDSAGQALFRPAGRASLQQGAGSSFITFPAAKNNQMSEISSITLAMNHPSSVTVKSAEPSCCSAIPRITDKPNPCCFALDEGQFRVVSIDVTLEAGEHTISVGGTSKTVTVE